MNPRFRFLSLAFAGLFFLGAPAPNSWAQQERNIARISISLHPDKDEYWVGEPVHLRARAVNWHSPVVILTSTYGLMSAYTDLRISYEGDVGDTYKAHYSENIPMPHKHPLWYGKALEFDMLVSYDKNQLSGMAMKEPGKYFFALRQTMYMRDEYRKEQRRDPFFCSTQSRTIRVVSPPAEFAGALDLLRSRPSVFRDLNRNLASLSNRDLLEQIAREYPQSRYAPYCLHALGNLGVVLTSSISGESEKAIEAFQRIVEKHPGYPLRDEVRISLAEIHARGGHYNEAQRIVRAVVEESEDNLMRFRERRLIKALLGPRPSPYFQTNTGQWPLFSSTRLTDAYFLNQFDSSTP